MVLKSTRRQKTILGVPVPRKVPSVDVKKVAKSVGKASKQFGETSKSVSKDIERVGDRRSGSARSWVENGAGAVHGSARSRRPRETGDTVSSAARVGEAPVAHGGRAAAAWSAGWRKTRA